jgi:hypothetical protein
MRWYLNRQGKLKGLFEKAKIIEAISAGRIALDDMLCQEGTEEWIPVRDLGAFAAAAPQEAESIEAVVGAPTLAAGTSEAQTVRLPWLPIIGLALGTIGAGVITWRLFALDARELQILEELREANTHSNAALTELRKLTAPPTWLDEKDMMNDCKTNRDTVTCTFTNTHKFPATTCVKGLLYQKEASGVRLQALPMCTGRLMPAETKTVTSAWIAGFADDICNRDGYGGKVLDWSKCVFTTEPFDLSAVGK